MTVFATPAFAPETAPTHDEVLEQLDRIFRDARFAGAERHTRFLRYVVERTLEGQSSVVKEMVIATELYGRSSDYDPKVDSVVRVEATRLRARLDAYYQQSGANDPVRITIPKGTYVPRFDWNRVPEPPAADPPGRTAHRWWPWVAMACFVPLALGGLWQRGAAGVPAPSFKEEARAAWQEGNDLLAQDPHTGISDRGAPPTLERAIERFEYAVAEEPGFARAWASLAEAYEYASAYVGRDAAEDGRRAEAAARRAIALDPKLAAGHAMLGLVLFCIRWNLAGAEAAYRRALELDARNAYAVVEYADLLRETGRVTQAEAEVRKARGLLPAHPVLAWKEAEIQLDFDRPDAAIAAATSAIRMRQDYTRAYVALGMAWERKGDFERALEIYRKALAMDSRDRRALPAYGYLLGRLGRRPEALEVARQLEDMNSRLRKCAFQVALVYVGLGEHERALEWLERAHAARQMHVPFAAVEYRFRPLHGHPRFSALLQRVGLPAAV